MLKNLAKLLHPSWLLAVASLGMLLGIAAEWQWQNILFEQIQWLIIALAILLVALIKRTFAMILLALVAGVVIGLWRGANVLVANSNYQKLIGQTLQIQAQIADDVTQKNGATGMKLKSVIINHKKMDGEIWASARTKLALKRNDTVTLTGKLDTGFGKFAASMSYGKLIKVTRDPHGDLPRQLRDNFTNGLRKAMPEPEASLGAGYLDGQHNDLPQDLVKNLELVGLIHIVIAGGYNVTILIRYVRRWLSKVSKYWSMLGSLLVLGGILLVTGFSAPMSRTIVITVLSLMAWYYGRKFHPLVLLPLSAAVTALIDPSFVGGEVGWYLTFVAYGGLIILGPLLEKFFWDNPAPNNFRRIFIDTLSVQIVTMPLLAYAFQQYSIYGLLANLLVLPLMPITMLLATIAGVGGMFLPSLAAHIVGYPAYILLTYAHNITNRLASSPGAQYSANFSVGAVAISYIVIIAIILLLWRKTKHDFRNDNIIK